MATSGAIYNFLMFIHLPIDVRNICVLLAPRAASSVEMQSFACLLACTCGESHFPFAFSDVLR